LKLEAEGLIPLSGVSLDDEGDVTFTTNGFRNKEAKSQCHPESQLACAQPGLMTLVSWATTRCIVHTPASYVTSASANQLQIYLVPVVSRFFIPSGTVPFICANHQGQMHHNIYLSKLVPQVYQEVYINSLAKYMPDVHLYSIRQKLG